MPDQALHACAYRVVRYTPNLVRDEWVNIGVLIHDPAAKRTEIRIIEEQIEFGRVRRLHPNADETFLRALQAELEAQLAAREQDWDAYMAELDQTLSNLVQLSPQKGVLTDDAGAELERLYESHVAPVTGRGASELPNTRRWVRKRCNQVFRSAGIWTRLEKQVRIDEFTHPGNPLRIDYSYQRNGTRGFVHAISLMRDPGLATELAYAAERIRARLAGAEFVAVTEARPLRENERHQYVAQTLREQQIELVPVPDLEGFVNRLRPMIH